MNAVALICLCGVAVLGLSIGGIIDKLKSSEYPRTRQVSKVEDFAILVTLVVVDVVCIFVVVKQIAVTTQAM